MLITAPVTLVTTAPVVKQPLPTLIITAPVTLVTCAVTLVTRLYMRKNGGEALEQDAVGVSWS